MKSAMYETVPSPYGGWNVKEIKRDGILRHFEKREEAEQYLRQISITEPRNGPMIIDIPSGKETKSINSRG